MSKSPAKKIEHMEGVCIGAGFLLKKLQMRYGSDFGVGMAEQVRDCIRDCQQIENAYVQRRDREKQQTSQPGSAT